jgi:hypothetical protein
MVGWYDEKIHGYTGCIKVDRLKVVEVKIKNQGENINESRIN